jgi:predicted dehydrogenase
MHVLVEKPLTLKSEDAEGLIDLAEARGFNLDGGPHLRIQLGSTCPEEIY